MVSLTSLKYISGLQVNANPYVGKTGELGGRTSAIIADNVVLTRQKMIGNRRGFTYFHASTTAQVDAMFDYQNFIIQHQDNDVMYYSDPDDATRTAYAGTYTPPYTVRMDGAIARGSFLFTSTQGVMKLDGVTATPVRAGMTKALDVRGVTTGSDGFLSGYNKVAYRITWVREDTSHQQIRSDVSAREVITNATRVSVTSITRASTTATVTTTTAHGYSTADVIFIEGATQPEYNGSFAITSTGSTTFTYTVAGSPATPATGTILASRAMNASLQFSVPFDILAGDSWEVWRTVAVDAAGDPGDDMYLVSKTLNATAAGAVVTYVDTSSDTVIASNTPLYTNAVQSGALSGNSRPPLCGAIETFKDYTLYGRTAIDHQLTLNMLATINFVNDTSSITFTRTDAGGSKTYIGSASENVGTRKFKVYTGGVSTASDIEDTVKSLCHVINRDSTGYWYCDYAAGINSNPGIVRVFARSPTTGPFAVTVNNSTTGDQFDPTLPTSGSTILSDDDARANRIFYSKAMEPDSVPILNYFDVGRLDQPILRLISIRDACIIIKADGIWTISGQLAPFSVTELDTTCHCVAPATAVSLNNSVILLSNQGVVKVSMSGVTILSYPIEPLIMGDALPLENLFDVAFGVAHESERQYCLWLPTAHDDTYATQAMIFHTIAEEWCRWTKPATCGIVMINNYKLYIASGQEDAVLVQRKNGDETDYSDEPFSVTVISQASPAVTLTWPSIAVFSPVVGMSLHQGGESAKITAVTHVSGTTYVVTLDRGADFEAGAAVARMPIVSHIRLSPNNAGESGMSKTFYSASFLLESGNVTQAAIEIATNEAGLMQTFAITRQIAAGWGSSPWGLTPWGDLVSPVRSIPWLIDLPCPDTTGETISCGWYHSVSQEQFLIAQVSICYDKMAEYVVTA